MVGVRVPNCDSKPKRYSSRTKKAMFQQRVGAPSCKKHRKEKTRSYRKILQGDTYTFGFWSVSTIMSQNFWIQLFRNITGASQRLQKRLLVNYKRIGIKFSAIVLEIGKLFEIMLLLHTKGISPEVESRAFLPNRDIQNLRLNDSERTLRFLPTCGCHIQMLILLTKQLQQGVIG